ncbi:MAG: DNA-3-methyladenine glycosylase [Chloroflexota bacterium]
MPEQPVESHVVTHLRRDPIMAAIIDRCGPPTVAGPFDPADYFGRLARAIIFQQLSGKAATAILNKVLAVLPGGELTPAGLVAAEFEQLRACGLSRQKATYVTDLAARVHSGELELHGLPRLEEADVIAQLTQVKGIGRWTAHMFLMFTLGRPDILAVDDLGIRTAIKRAYELEEMPTPGQMEEIAEPWRPYRTHACSCLWNSIDMPV